MKWMRARRKMRMRTRRKGNEGRAGCFLPANLVEDNLRNVDGSTMRSTLLLHQVVDR